MTTVAAALVALAAPAAAHAAAYSVSAGNGPCGGVDLACGSLGEAAAVAATGDTFAVAPGTYDAAEFPVGGVRITGAPGVAINGTMTFSGNTGGPSTLEKVAIAQPVGIAPAINVSGQSGLKLLDAVAVSLNGDAIIITGGTGNQIIRTLVVTGGAATSAVRVSSTTGTPAKGLLLESSLLRGGAASLSADSSNLAIEAGAGDITITAHHLTAAGSTNGIVLDSSNAASLLSGPVGNITANVTDSIALNNKVKRYSLLLSPNVAEINAVRTIQTHDVNTLFADPGHANFRLRPDATDAIDAGGFTTGESATDIDGDPRPGPTTDLGADEFVNAAPTAVLVVKGGRARAGQPVLLDGTGSTDRETNYGGGIVQYRWDFGDGTTQITTTPTIMHTYGAEGAAGAQLVVVDRQGAPSAPAVARVDVGDGVAPEVTITKPFPNQNFKLTTTTTKTVTKNGKKTKVTTKKKHKLSFGGAAKDKSGVAFVLLTIEKIGGATASTSAKTSQAKTSKALCTWFDSKKGLLKTSCVKPKLLVAKLAKDGSWSYTPPAKVKALSPGLYRVSAYGADGSGAFGNTAPSKDAVIRFRLSK
jgi:hypothetical protein